MRTAWVIPRRRSAAGLLDADHADGVTVVEWADRLEDWLPAERLEIHLETPAGAPMSRFLRVTAAGAAHQELAAQALGTS